MQQDIQEIEKIKGLMDKLNANFNAYRDEVIHSAGWADKDKLTAHPRSAFIQTLGEVIAAVLPEPSNNVVAVGELRIYQPMALDDVEALLNGTTLHLDKSKQS